MSRPTPTDPSEVFTWKIENFSKLKHKKFCSKSFNCGGYNWRLLMYPKGKTVLIYPKGKTVESLSVYLDASDSARLPQEWSKQARLSISVVNQIRYEDTICQHTEHKFNARERVCGYNSLLPLNELNDPKAGFLVNDTVILEAVVAVPNSHDSSKQPGSDPNSKKWKNETADNGSGNAETDAAGSGTYPQSKVRFLSYWVSPEALLLLEKIHRLHEGTYAKFSMKGQFLPTMLLESFASFVVSMSSTKVSELNEEALQRAANSIQDFEQVGLDLRWLKQRLGEAKRVKKVSESVNTVESCMSALEVARATVESCTSALEVARAKVRELEEGLAKAKAEGEEMSRELPESLGVNDSVLKDIV